MIGHAKQTWRKQSANSKPPWCDFYLLYICIVLHYTELHQDANSSNSLVAAICVSHHLLCIPRVSVTRLLREIPTTSHLRNKLGLSQREIECTEGVRSQRDLHLLCGIAQLALHRHNLHNSLQSGFGFRWARGQPKTERKHASRHMVIQTKESESNGKSYLVWVTERIFIHNIPGCENSGGWSQSINTGLKSTCGDCKANGIWSKINNLHKSFPWLVGDLTPSDSS